MLPIRRRNYWLAVVFALCGAARAQEQRLSVDATVYTGFYEATSRGDINQSIQFVPLGAELNVDGYLITPDFLTFTAIPQGSVGPQATEAGVQGGNGIRFRSTLLRHRAFPLTFRYSNVQVEDVFFGTLSQISGYRLMNRNKDLGVTWEFHPTKTASLVADWGTGSVDSKSDVAQISDYLSTQNHINVDGQIQHAGWDFVGFAHMQNQSSNLLTAINGTAQPGTLTQTVDQYQASARKTWFRDTEFYVDGGMQSTASVLFTLPINLRTEYGNISLRLFQKRRWKSSIRSGYSSNLASQLLSQEISTLTSPGAVAPNVTTVLMPFSYGIANLNAMATTNGDLGHGFGVYATAERNQVLSADQTGPVSSNYFTTTAGLDFAKSMGAWNWSGQYGRELGSGSVTGQSGTISGDIYRAAVQRTTSGGNVFEVNIHGSDEKVSNAQPLSNNSFAADASVALSVTQNWSARVGGGWQRSDFMNDANQFRSNGYTLRFSAEHPRYQINASLSNSLSDSLPFFNQFVDLGVGAVLLNSLQVIPSDYRALSFGVHATPVRKVEISGAWTRSVQHLAGVLNNDFELLDIHATYHFRRLEFEGGYIHFSQLFENYPTTIRTRFYVKIQRKVHVL